MKSNIDSLRQRKITIKTKARQMLEKGNLTPAENQEYETLLSQLHAAEADVLKAEQELDAARNAPGGVLIPMNGTGGAPAYHAQVDERRPATGKKYAQMFPTTPLSSDGFNSFDEYLKAWENSTQQFDPRLRAAQNEGVPSQGGFLVPSEYSQQILDQALESEIVRPRAQVWPMASDTRKVPGIDNFDHSANIYGFSAAWTDELGTGTPKDAKYRLVELHAQKLMLIGQSSNELLADAVGAGGFASVFGSKMTAAASWFLDDAFLNGDGAGKPLGVNHDPALIVVSKESTQGAGTLVYENVTKMIARLHPSCFSNATWVCNSTCLSQLLEMQLVVKNVAGTENVGGSAVPVFSQMPDGTFRLLTRPLILTEKLPQIGTQGDIVLADFSQYAVGMRKEIALEQSIHPGFLSDSTYFRIVTRVDGQGTWKSAVTPKNGVSQSWCVTLQAR